MYPFSDSNFWFDLKYLVKSIHLKTDQILSVTIRCKTRFFALI